MRIGHTITHLPTHRDGICKGLPFQRRGVRYVRVLFAEGIEYVKETECHIKCKGRPRVKAN